MRKLLHVRLLFAMTALGALGVWVACGGSDPQDVDAKDAGRDTAPIEPEDTGPIERPDSGPLDAGRDSGRLPFDAGGIELVDGGTLYEGGIECFRGGSVEIEPNDDKANANPVQLPRCGALFPDGGEIDWLSFRIDDASTGGFELYYEGLNLKVEVDIDGSVTDISDPARPDPVLPLVRNAPYYVRITSRDGGSEFWRFIMRENDGGRRP
jgi:hypothetical protein